ncbi:transcription repressor NadR [Alkalihalobacterium bogoriense]|uniref:transcription repressor NadR n=1 Tax=Alkalihalobacterium bogoriense TaxID=246272 RepID=UPI00047EAECD|nr:transcription repressor NadR [Alkalihalobacterium bogoriense]
MVEKRKKVLGEERRELILHWLLQSITPITGNELAERTNVSRQVIVQDISILKARNHSILATAQGYMYIKQQGEEQMLKRRIACQHLPEETEQELMILVDHGVTVKDVMVEHPIYGDLTASLMLSNRRDVHLFLTKMKSTNASLLSELTDGVHLHTIEAETNEQLDDATDALKQAGFLLSITE